MRFLKGFGRFWYEFIIGDDWKIAASTVAALLVGVVALAAGAPPAGTLAPVLAALVLLAFTAAFYADVRRSRRK